MMRTDENRVEVGTLDAVINRARAGDEAAFEQLYRDYRRRVFGLCRHLLGSVEAAEDATSDVFLRARKAMSTYDAALPIDRWLLSIASHLCIDQLRRRKVERRLFEPSQIDSPEPAGKTISPLAGLVTAEQQQRVRDAIEKLPGHYGLPLTLRYYNEMSYDQIAAALNLTRNNVATLIFRAKQELRRRLTPAREALQ